VTSPGLSSPEQDQNKDLESSQQLRLMDAQGNMQTSKLLMDLDVVHKKEQQAVAKLRKIGIMVSNC
jgi:hypothetical protein